MEDKGETRIFALGALYLSLCKEGSLCPNASKKFNTRELKAILCHYKVTYNQPIQRPELEKLYEKLKKERNSTLSNLNASPNFHKETNKIIKTLYPPEALIPEIAPNLRRSTRLKLKPQLDKQQKVLPHTGLGRIQTQLLPISAPPKPFSASKRKSTTLESEHLPTKRKRVEKSHYQPKLDDQGQLSLHEKQCQPSSQLEESARSEVFNPAATASGCILKGILRTKSSNVQQALNQFSNLAADRVSLLHETSPFQEAHLCCGQSTLVDGHAHYKSPASKTDNYKSNTSQPKRSVDNFNHKKNLIHVDDSPPHVDNSPPHVDNSLPHVEDSPPLVDDSPPHVDDSPPQNPTPRPEFPAGSQSLNKAEVALDNLTQSSSKSKKRSSTPKSLSDLELKKILRLHLRDFKCTYNRSRLVTCYERLVAKKKLQEDKCIKKLRLSQHGPSGVYSSGYLINRSYNKFRHKHRTPHLSQASLKPPLSINHSLGDTEAGGVGFRPPLSINHSLGDTEAGGAGFVYVRTNNVHNELTKPSEEAPLITHLDDCLLPITQPENDLGPKTLSINTSVKDQLSANYESEALDNCYFPKDKQILIDSHNALDISQISVASFKHHVESVTATTEASDNRGPSPSDISKNDFERLECFAPDAATLDLCQAANGILPVVLSTVASLTEDPKITKNTLKSNYALTETTSNSGPSTLGTSVSPESLGALSTKHNSTLVEIAIQADPKEPNEPNEAHSSDEKTLALSSEVFVHVPTGPTSMCANSSSNASPIHAEAIPFGDNILSELQSVTHLHRWKSIKQQNQNLVAWPYVETLTTAQIREYLDLHFYSYENGNCRPHLVSLYNILVSSKTKPKPFKKSTEKRLKSCLKPSSCRSNLSFPDAATEIPNSSTRVMNEGSSSGKSTKGIKHSKRSISEIEALSGNSEDDQMLSANIASTRRRSRTRTAISSSSSLQNSSSTSRHYQTAEQTGFVLNQPSTVITPSFQVEPSSGRNHLSLPIDISTAPQFPSTAPQFPSPPSKGGNEELSPVQLAESTKLNKRGFSEIETLPDPKELSVSEMKLYLKRWDVPFGKHEKRQKIKTLYSCLVAQKKQALKVSHKRLKSCANQSTIYSSEDDQMLSANIASTRRRSRTRTAISSSSSLQNSSSTSRHYQTAEQTGFVLDQPSTVITPSFQVEPSSGRNHLSLPLDISPAPDVPSSSSKGGNEDMSPVQLIEGTKQNKQSIPEVKELPGNKNERYSQLVALYRILAEKINKRIQKPSCFEGSRGPQLVRQLSTQLRLKQPQENIEVQPLIIANDHLSENSRGSVCSSNNQFFPPDHNHQKNLPGNPSTSRVSLWRTQVLSSADEDTALQETLYLKETFQELVNQNKDVIDRLDSLVEGVKSLSIRAQELPSKPGSQPTGNPSNIPRGGPLHCIY
ncbi:hypothetical protein BY996DRAFT_6423287 [Phakopsora pachyrhizi]|nr:hypothetical protein BY996DRAFT_6423287 [Phakopsora pachyrhizi]